MNVVPDLASLSVTVNRSATTSRAALSAANTRTDLITRAIRALGVPSSGIQTQSVNVSNTSHKAGPKHNRHLVRRFTATESLSVTSAATLAGAVIDAATHNGASSANGLSFSFSNPAAGQIAANSAALANRHPRPKAHRRRPRSTLASSRSTPRSRSSTRSLHHPHRSGVIAVARRGDSIVCSTRAIARGRCPARLWNG